MVADGWLDGLRDAAASGGSGGHRIGPHPAGPCALELATWLRRRSRPWRGVGSLPAAATPTAAAHGPCVYVRRSALELIGEEDAAALTRAELSRRCTEAGLATCSPTTCSSSTVGRIPWRGWRRPRTGDRPPAPPAGFARALHGISV